MCNLGSQNFNVAGRLKEIFLIVRPEEKRKVETALGSVIAPFYTMMRGLGRGTQGGLSYEKPRRSPWLFDKRPPGRTTFLPKVIFHFVIPETLVDEVIKVTTAALGSSGGPEDCGLGVAIVADIEAEREIDGGYGIPSAALRSPAGAGDSR